VGKIVHFTLANLLAATAIMAMLVVTLVPFSTGIGATLALETAAEQLAQELQAARQLAIVQNVTYDVKFERQDRAYLVKKTDIFAPSRRIYLPPGVDWVNFPFEILFFYGTGRCSQGGTIILGHGETNFQIQVTVASRTGRVRVLKRYQ